MYIVIYYGLGVNDTTSEECEKLRCPRFRIRLENITRVQIDKFKYLYDIIQSVARSFDEDLRGYDPTCDINRILDFERSVKCFSFRTFYMCFRFLIER